MLHGIDVSEWQGQLDWSRLEFSGGKLSFAFAKATEGTSEVDSRFRHNWHDMRDAGLVRGAYHYATPQGGQAVARQARAEAEHLLGEIEAAGGMHPGDLPPALDLEQQSGLTAGELHAWVGEWAETVHRAVGRRPIIYTGGFWKEMLGEFDDAFGCPLWLSQYGPPEVPRAWRSWTFWQYSASGHVDGIASSVDLDYFHGDAKELEALTLGSGERQHHEPPHSHSHSRPRPGGVPAWGGRVLREGVRGDDVKEWQARMRERGFVDLAADGVFGPRSAESCRWLQIYLREPPDEQVDERMWTATWASP